MNIVVVSTITVRVIAVFRCSRNLIVEYPGGWIVGLDGWWCNQRRCHNRVLCSVQTLYVFVGITERHVVLTAVAVYDICFDFYKLNVHSVVDASSIAVEIWTGSYHCSPLAIEIETDVVSIIGTAS